MTEPAGSERTERLEQELAQAREQRDRLAVELGGEDPEDPDLGDRGDAAVELEELDDLARMNRRIAEIERLLAGQVVAARRPGSPTAPWSRSGSRTGRREYRIVAIPEGGRGRRGDGRQPARSGPGRTGCRGRDPATRARTGSSTPRSSRCARPDPAPGGGASGGVGDAAPLDPVVHARPPDAPGGRSAHSSAVASPRRHASTSSPAGASATVNAPVKAGWRVRSRTSSSSVATTRAAPAPRRPRPRCSGGG